MKSKYVIPALALLFCMGASAQKDQLKALEKATKNFDAANVKNTLLAAEAAVANAEDSYKAQFYYLKGNALFELSKKNVETGTNLVGAAKAYQELLALEKIMGKSKYSSQAEEALKFIKDQLVNSAIEDNKADRHKAGSIKLYEAYKINPKDTIYLYYAANGAIQSKEYDKAIDYLGQLKNLNFTGIRTEYYAFDKETLKETTFNNKDERDLFVKAGTHQKPRSEKLPSMRIEIYRNYSLLLADKGQLDKALQEIQEARRLYPNDADFVIIEADFYNKKGDKENYVRILKEASEKAPGNTDLIYNLGVAHVEMNKKDEAIKYFNRAIEAKPDYVNAYIYLANMKVEEQTKIFEEMNNLGNSPADNKKYNELMEKKNKLLQEAIPYLETALKIKPNNLDILNMMTQIYPTLGLDAKYKEAKAKIDQINDNK